MQRWIKKQREFLALQAIASDRAGGFQAITKFLQTTMGSVLLGLAAFLLLHDKLNGGGAMLIVSSILGGRMLAPLVQIVTQWRLVVSRARFVESPGHNCWRRSRPSRLPCRCHRPRASCTSTTWWPGRRAATATILKGVAFGLKPGEVLGVIGPSASGKTTLARLLVGLWPAASGKVRLDGADVFAWEKAELGPCVGYLPQDVELFDGTLAENIARFGPAEPAKVQAAARAIGLDEYILSLPDGYDTQVGREGAILSGGQRQRVGLARAIFGDPVLVVLDEPNSSLDESGDAALAATILALKSRGTTFVVMTHRTGILPVVDKLLVLMDGQVKAFGPRDEVLEAMAKAAAQAQQAAQQRAAAAAAPKLVPTA